MTRLAPAALAIGKLWLLGLVLTALVASRAAADRQDCFQISDADQRHLCIADYDGKRACDFISDADQRNYCKAVNGEGKATCTFINDEQLRAKCRAKCK